MMDDFSLFNLDFFITTLIISNLYYEEVTIKLRLIAFRGNAVWISFLRLLFMITFIERKFPAADDSRRFIHVQLSM